jgi:hypothetical protein
MLLQMTKPDKVLVQFEATVKQEPRRFRSLYGAAHAAHADKPGRREIREALEALAPQKT